MDKACLMDSAINFNSSTNEVHERREVERDILQHLKLQLLILKTFQKGNSLSTQRPDVSGFNRLNFIDISTEEALNFLRRCLINLISRLCSTTTTTTTTTNNIIDSTVLIRQDKVFISFQVERSTVARQGFSFICELGNVSHDKSRLGKSGIVIEI
ncbi:hypothetical protein WICPIJ_004845 [Wickerhamomyces pijperi]|uniref:Uncharacterized protein n=1 Tax=Wickerhamomyces pijperi TaxID=599730 RepID=A0A9P8Q569_WICPI|nr:hypothetical protein WICPIJ_004845 [Wickerhamomyces pijperi]